MTDLDGRASGGFGVAVLAVVLFLLLLVAGAYAQLWFSGSQRSSQSPRAPGAVQAGSSAPGTVGWGRPGS